jgi:hypothetical protein
MTAKPLPITPEAKFREAVERKLMDTERPRGFVIPQLSADPPETDATNLWMRNDGRLRGRYRNSGGTFTYVDYPMRTDWGSPAAVPANPAPPSPGPVPQTYQTTWSASWSQTYTGTGSQRTDTIGETSLVYGASGADAYGQQHSLIGFDYASIASTLASSTIQRIELVMTNLEAYWSSVQVFFGMHNYTAEPVTSPTWEIILRKTANVIAEIGDVRTQLPMAYAQALRDGTAKGLVLEAPSAERGFYGYAAGVGSGYTVPQLTITYAK